MRIQIENYLLSQDTNSPTRFNLSVIKTRGDKSKDAGGQYEYDLAYGISIKTAVELIASYELLEREDVVSLGEYVRLFDEQLKRFDKLLEV